jgi:hypothetical protein
MKTFDGWRYNSTSLDSRHYMEASSQFLAPAASLSKTEPPVPIGWKAGRPQRRYERYREKKNLAPVGNRTPDVLPIARRYTDWATPALHHGL